MNMITDTYSYIIRIIIFRCNYAANSRGCLASCVNDGRRGAAGPVHGVTERLLRTKLTAVISTAVERSGGSAVHVRDEGLALLTFCSIQFLFNCVC